MFKHTIETKRKMSETKKRLYSEGKLITWNKGHGEYLPIETRKRINDMKRGKPNLKSSETKRRLFKEGKLKIWNKNIPRDQKTKEKLSIKMKEWYKTHKHPNKGKHIWKDKPHPRNMLGKHHSEETKRKLREIQSGEKCHLWKGGISFEPYGLEFNRELKKQIRKRDNYTCQECGHTQEHLGYKLNIHHIDFNKKNNDPNNLISLCKSCHGQTIYKREDWINYFQDKMKGGDINGCN